LVHIDFINYMLSSDKSKQITIKNSFPDNIELFSIANEIYFLIKEEKNLSFRKIEELKKLLENNMINCLFIENTLAGFLISHKLGKNLIEINGLYVKTQFREKNMSSLLINYATQNCEYNYFAATFLRKVKQILESHGFEETDLGYLNYLEKVNFLKQRLKLHRIKEFFRHKKNSKLILLKKECRKQF
jgi:hypothetical protein